MYKLKEDEVHFHVSEDIWLHECHLDWYLDFNKETNYGY